MVKRRSESRRASDSNLKHAIEEFKLIRMTKKNVVLKLRLQWLKF